MGIVIVTGGAGFIGSHVVEALAARGYDVVVVDDFSSGSPDNLRGARPPRLRVLSADVSCSRDLWDKLSGIRRGDLEAIVHLAAVTGVEETRADLGSTAREGPTRYHSIL